jgi:hypothetical protein
VRTVSPDPYVYPLTGVMDLLGRMPVRLTVKDGELVAYGFGDQRIAIPAAEVGAVAIHRGWGKQFGRSGPAIVVLDKNGQMLLRARGIWGAAAARSVMTPPDYRSGNGGLDLLCRRLGIAAPKYLTYRDVKRQGPGWRHAPGFRKLQVRPSGYRLAVAFLCLLWLVLSGLGVTVGVLLAGALPAGIGAVRNLIGLALSVGAVWAAFWLRGLLLSAVRWLAVSLRVRSPAPPDRFFGPDPRRARRARTWLTVLMVLAIPALIGWGPVIGLISLTHGFADQALVSTLRHGGIATTGYVIDVPTYSTDSDGNTVVTDHPTLQFQTLGGVVVRTPDPAIAGWTWPMDPRQPVTIVYDRARHATAAVAGQISGSPWHGAPVGNVVSGALLTVALLPLTWMTVRRIQAARRESREGFLEGLA